MWNKQALMSILALAATLPVYAQSVESCMTAKAEEAIDICQQILDKGRQEINVYYKLSSELYQQGFTQKSNVLLENALGLYPNNQKLTTLKKFIDSDLAEQTMLEEAAQRNNQSFTAGELKITCRTQNSLEGLQACDQYLNLAGENDEQIQARVAELRINIFGDSEFSSPTANLPLSERRIEYKRDVTDAQSSLNYLGLDAGVEDGIPGPKTWNALREFYGKLGIPEHNSIDEITLSFLRKHKTLLQEARETLIKSENAAERGELLEALTMLEQAINTSNFLVVSPLYRGSLNNQLAKNTNTDFKQLMNQIQLIQDRLKYKADNANKRLQMARTKTSAILQ